MDSAETILFLLSGTHVLSDLQFDWTHCRRVIHPLGNLLKTHFISIDNVRKGSYKDIFNFQFNEVFLSEQKMEQCGFEC